MKDVIEVLRSLGYSEIRLGDKRWRPLADANGTLGTTDETCVIQEDEPPRIRLRDPETGEEIGRARRSLPSEADPPAQEGEEAG
jgi:hypothetical protein